LNHAPDLCLWITPRSENLLCHFRFPCSLTS
jgi:hypothetical protein